MLIGVVGKSGSGKSSLVERMKKFDNAIIHIDIDKIGHEILKDKDIINRIVEIVKDPTIVVNGMIDRKKLGNIVFNDLNKYKNYYSYTEEVEYQIIDKIINDNMDKKVFLDWVMLDKTKYWKILDFKILVKTEINIRKQRVLKRDNVSEEYFALREAKRLEYNEDKMDYIIDGNNISDAKIKEILGELK